MRVPLIVAIFANILVIVTSTDTTTNVTTITTTSSAAAAAASSSKGNSAAAASGASSKTTVIKTTKVENNNSTGNESTIIITTITKTSSAAAATAASSSKANSAAAASAASSKTTVKNKTQVYNNNSTGNENSQSTEDNGSNTKPAVCPDDCNSQLRTAIFKYTSLFLCDLFQTYPNQAVTGSPAASLYILGLLGIYSRGNSRKEILRALNLENATNERIRYEFSKISKYLSAYSEGIEFSERGTFAISSCRYRFSDPFERDLNDVFLGQVLNVDFRNLVKAANYINSQVQNVTNNKITEVVSAKDLCYNNEIQLAFVTSLYFSGGFKIRFNPMNTMSGPFYTTPTKSVEVQYLCQTEAYKYINSTDICAEVLIVPTEADDYKFVFILPHLESNISYVNDKLKDETLFDSVYNSAELVEVDFRQPTYDNVTTLMNSKRITQENLNISSLKPSNKIELNNVIVGQTCLSESFGIQKFVFESNLNGGPSPGIPEGLKKVTFCLNRPYIYYVLVKCIPIICGVQRYE